MDVVKGNSMSSSSSSSNGANSSSSSKKRQSLTPNASSEQQQSAKRQRSNSSTGVKGSTSAGAAAAAAAATSGGGSEHHEEEDQDKWQVSVTISSVTDTAVSDCSTFQKYVTTHCDAELLSKCDTGASRRTLHRCTLWVHVRYCIQMVALVSSPRDPLITEVLSYCACFVVHLYLHTWYINRMLTCIWCLSM
jgi:hypothetical protein